MKVFKFVKLIIENFQIWGIEEWVAYIEKILGLQLKHYLGV